jgi:hypothetical protein
LLGYRAFRHCYDEDVAEVCSCGTQLVEGALFCHRCGKPTFDAPEEETQEPVPQEIEQLLDRVELSHTPPEINFSNGAAVRVALLVAAISMVLLVPLANLAGMSLVGIVLPTLFAGVLSVWFYQRRTGTPLTVLAGARMGWITGVFIFALFLVLFTITLVPAIESGELQKIQEAALKGSFSEADMQKLKEIFENPVMLSLSILLFMGIYFVGATTLSSLGGMLGAKLLGRNQSL